MAYDIRFGDVWRDDGRTHICSGSEELAIAYDPETGTTLKIGAAIGVRKWLETHLAKLDASGLRSMFADPLIAAMPVTETSVQLLNRISDNCLLIQSMIERGELPGQALPPERLSC